MKDIGWICPVCGKGLAPWARECDCYTGIQPVAPVPNPWPNIPMPFGPDITPTPYTYPTVPNPAYPYSPPGTPMPWEYPVITCSGDNGCESEIISDYMKNAKGVYAFCNSEFLL
jgi:hypothetical protein